MPYSNFNESLDDSGPEFNRLREKSGFMQYESLRARMARRQVLISLSLISIGFILFALRDMFGEFFPLSPLTSVFLAAFFSLPGIALLLLMYLRGSLPYASIRMMYRPKDLDDPDTSRIGFVEDEVKSIESSINELRNRLDNLSQSRAGITSEDKEAVLSRLRAEIIGNLTDALHEKFVQESGQNALYANVRSSYEELSTRLKREVGNLSRRGNLNLVIGVLTTGIAVVLLVYMVFGVSGPFDDLTKLLSFYIPRITTAAFIEIFAFFFLRLYKSSLSEIKYYQNELTRLGCQRVALDAANGHADPATISAVIKEIASIGPDQPEDNRTKKGLDADQTKAVSEILDKVTNLVAAVTGKK